MKENEIIKKLGIVGQRLQLELKGYKCLPLEKTRNPKKEIQVSRSFGPPVTKLEDLTQALATHAIKASEKMRSQNLQSSDILEYLPEPVNIQVKIIKEVLIENLQMQQTTQTAF